MKIYEWKDGRIYSSKDPQVIGQYLEDIATKEGEIKPVRLVKLAEDAKNPLHDFFTWDDSIAAQKFREQQARELLQSIKVTIKESRGEQIRAFVNIRTDGNSSYKPITVVLNNPIDFDYIIERARVDLEAFARKYSKYQELSKSVGLIKKAIESLPFEKEKVA